MKKTVPAFLRQAARYVEYWAPRLRLENLEIEVVAAPEDFNAYASMTCDVFSQHALLKVQDPKIANKPPDGAVSLACHDLEVTIVHELIHARFGEVMQLLPKKAGTANEIATEMLAMALVAERRGVEPRSLYD